MKYFRAKTKTDNYNYPEMWIYVKSKLGFFNPYTFRKKCEKEFEFLEVHFLHEVGATEYVNMEMNAKKIDKDDRNFRMLDEI